MTEIPADDLKAVFTVIGIFEAFEELVFEIDRLNTNAKNPINLDRYYKMLDDAKRILEDD